MRIRIGLGLGVNLDVDSVGRLPLAPEFTVDLGSKFWKFCAEPPPYPEMTPHPPVADRGAHCATEATNSTHASAGPLHPR
jgi:hypothetical protein